MLAYTETDDGDQDYDYSPRDGWARETDRQLFTFSTRFGVTTP